MMMVGMVKRVVMLTEHLRAGEVAHGQQALLHGVGMHLEVPEATRWVRLEHEVGVDVRVVRRLHAAGVGEAQREGVVVHRTLRAAAGLLGPPGQAALRPRRGAVEEGPAHNGAGAAVGEHPGRLAQRIRRGGRAEVPGDGGVEAREAPGDSLVIIANNTQ